MQQQVRVFTELDPINLLDLIRTRRLQEAAAAHLGLVDAAMRVQALRSLMVRALDKPDDMDRLKRVLIIIRPEPICPTTRSPSCARPTRQTSARVRDDLNLGPSSGTPEPFSPSASF